MTNVKVDFRDITTHTIIGTSSIPMDAIKKMKLGDVIEFKGVASMYGQFTIVSFEINEGVHDGGIGLDPIKPKAKIKLQQLNLEYMESILPF